MFYSKIKKGTEEFFCLCEDEQQRQLLQQKWIARRKRYCSKIYGVRTDQLDGDATPRFASVSSSRSHQNVFTTVSPGQPHPPVLQRSKSRKESVASMAWQGLKSKIIVSNLYHGLRGFHTGKKRRKNKNQILMSLLSVIAVFFTQKELQRLIVELCCTAERSAIVTLAEDFLHLLGRRVFGDIVQW